MPKVPYTPYPTAAPSEQGIRGLSLNTPGAAFGENIAAALGGLGKTVEGASDEIFKRAAALQEIDNRAKADDAATKYSIESGLLHAEYSSLSGNAAKEQLQPHIDKLDKLREEIKSNLTNPQVQRLYDSETRSQMARSVFSAARHAGEENKKYLGDVADRRIASVQNEALQNPTPQAIQRGFREIDVQVDGVKGVVKGWTPEQAEQDKFIKKSGLVVSAIEGVVKKDAEAAKAMLEAYREHLWAPNGDLQKAERLVQTGLWNSGAKRIAEEVLAPVRVNPDDIKISEQQLLDRADAAAKKIDPDDTVFHDFVRQKTMAGYNQLKTIKRNTDFERMSSVQEAINGGRGKKIPTTLEEMEAYTPDSRKAYDQLPVPMQRRVNGWLAQNAKDDYPKTEENFVKFQQLKGMASGDDSAKIEFLNKAIMDERIPREWRGELLNLQRKIKANAEQDPRVGVALRDLRSSGIPGFERSADKEKYDQFTGALQDALDTFQKDHNGRKPTSKELNEIGAVLVTQQSKGWMEYLGGKPDITRDPAYAKKAPDEIIEKIQDEQAKQGMPRPTAAQVQRAIIAEQFRTYYEKKKSESKK